MKNKRLALLVALTLIFSTASVYAADLVVNSWPASTVAVDISAAFNAAVPGIEPSGLAWHSGRKQLLLVGDAGQLVAMNTDGSNVTVWNVGGDLEDVAVVDPTSPYVYLGDENGEILEYNLSSGSITQTWSVNAWMPPEDCDGDPKTSGTCGMEALTYADGYFYAGYQFNGKIFKLDLSGDSAVKVTEYAGLSSYGYTNLAALSYVNGSLYALYDGAYLLEQMSLDGTMQNVYSVPGIDTEGFVIGEDGNGDGDANAYIAEDSTGEVYMYDNFPLPVVSPAPTLTDADHDGVAATSDCNDSDAAVSVFATFYVDADYDGNGSSTAASLCSATAPYGYSANSTDKYDTIPNAGVEIRDGIDNDWDSIVDEYNTVSWNGYHPYFSTLDANVSSKGKIIGYWGLPNGEIGIRYADWSVYRYQPFATKTKTFTKVTPVSGSAYFTVSLGSSTVTLNGYNGAIR